MHILGLQGMSRRIDTYSEGYGFELWNMVATIGSFILAIGVLIARRQHLLLQGQGQERCHRSAPTRGTPGASSG